MTEDENKDKNSDPTQSTAFSAFLVFAIFLSIFFAIWDTITQIYGTWPTWSYALCSTTLTSLLLWVAFAAKKSINPQTLSTQLKRQLSKLSLFATICLWVTAASIVYTALNWIWGQNGALSGWTLNGETSGPLERIKSSLVIIGGIGGVGYLVIKYRERSASERGEAEEKLLHAVQQLGESSAQVRIAGVYALANVADTYGDSYIQRVIDILCGYLRIDRTREGLREGSSTNDKSPSFIDGPVESTILSVLANHLRPSHPKFHQWTLCSLDLHGATLTETADFSSTYIGEIDARNTRFSTALFEHATFRRKANFEGSTFKRFANFKYTNFESRTVFNDAVFKRYVDFSGNSDGERTIFVGEVEFEGTRFSNGVSFCFTEFNQNSYSGAKFFGHAKFTCTEFNQCAKFSRITAYFGPNRQEPVLEFSGHFSQGVDFTQVGDMGAPAMHLSFNSTSPNKPTEINRESKITGYLNVHAKNANFDRFELFNYYQTPPDSAVTFTNVAITGGADFRADGITQLQFTDVSFGAAAEFSIPPASNINFTDVKFNSNLKNENDVSFPRCFQSSDGLPEGARWVEMDNRGFPLD